MNPTVASALVTSLFGFVGLVLVQRNLRKGTQATQRLSERVVDREEWESYTDRQDKERERLEKRIAELEDRMGKEVEAREAAERRAADAEERAEAAEKRAGRAEKQVDRLRRRVEQLEDILREHEMDVPPLPDEIPDLD